MKHKEKFRKIDTKPEMSNRNTNRRSKNKKDATYENKQKRTIFGGRQWKMLIML
jgi:hypothetical protein